ncbi:MAG: hypothetical protein ACFE9I_12365 [Candidatus Hermodarchaeota archaeon]
MITDLAKNSIFIYLNLLILIGFKTATILIKKFPKEENKLMLVSKIILKNEKFNDCPLCGAKIELIFEEDEKINASKKEISELEKINEADWLLP